MTRWIRTASNKRKRKLGGREKTAGREKARAARSIVTAR
jgi:hypothetical protein